MSTEAPVTSTNAHVPTTTQPSMAGHVGESGRIFHKGHLRFPECYATFALGVRVRHLAAGAAKVFHPGVGRYTGLS